MRLSTRLLTNAASNYARLAVAIVGGVFFTWYTVGKIGMSGLGMIMLTSAAFGVSAAVEMAVRRSLIREMAVAIASGDPARVRRSLNSAVVVCAPAALVLAGIAMLLAMLAHLGVFRTPEGVQGMTTALAILLLAEGAQASFRLLCAPWTQALFAGQHIVLDNALMALGRASNAISALLIFGLVLPEAPMDRQLIGFALTRSSLWIFNVLIGIVLAKWRVEGLQLRRGAFDRAEFRSIAGTVWHTGQFVLLMNLNVQFMAIVINLFFGMTYNGVWGIVVQLGTFARMLAEGLLRGIDPLSTHLLEQGRKPVILDLMMRIVRYQVGALLPVAAGLAIFVYPILDLWLKSRIALDRNLAAAGITVGQAIDLIAVMTWVYLAAQVVQSGLHGLERILYGVGEVRSYSWFGKYAATINVGLAALLMWLSGSPVAAPVALLVTYLLCYPGVILMAAVRRVGLPLGAMLRRSLPRPLASAAIFAAIMLIVRAAVPELTLLSLAAVVLGAGALYALLLYGIVFEADERMRVNQLVKRAIGHPADGGSATS